MASSILHITNGDSTTQILSNLNFDGEIITWREMLCEGKTTIDVGSENFWKTRFDFFKSSYKTTKKTFIDYTLKEYRNLCNQKQQNEIVLWFEYDLFCQINMVAVISWLKRYRKGRKISLVCSGTLKNKTGLHALGHLTQVELLNHYKNRVELTLDDIEYADYIWQLYCSDSPLRLETVHNFSPMSPFVYLEEAIKAHLQRFPSIKNGLNKLENQILDIANKQQLENQNQLIGEILKNQGFYGFGDLQYANKLQTMKKLFSSFSPVKLNRKGKKVLDNQLNFYGQIRSDFSYLGGSKKYSYLYVNDTDKLLKITS
ncbi:hypothetical protein SAMN04489761_0287 [Tenacibaculum sp. MAR_2009_124]|uniref:DUF1835 domain-containing protein n=1 Tax=Tenacibaculum sp. MAR_2009_124 TaxID=1250059 RepID=UPI00089C283D|nr:DUF1835 domain-containing protein [Tenacibaculum sp. MAR_2009_124]SEB37853.1 hypothetical protein SAMN04489761_0287 [Tenacibaculum sp. MAR_2009_124]